MAVRKICKPKGCRGSPRCDHPWWFDVMYGGKRWRMRVDEFALVRGASETVTSKQTAERVWEPKFLGEIIAARDPRVPPNKPDTSDVLTVAESLDRYQTNYVNAEGLKSADTIVGHLKALKASLGNLPVTALEKPADIARFKSEYRQGRKVATQSCPWCTTRGDQLGTIPGSAAAGDDAVPSLRRNDQGQGRDEAGSAHPPRRGADAPGRVPDDERGGT